jgi:hypothetical protein
MLIGGGLLMLGLVIPGLFLAFRKPSWRNPAPATDEGGAA